MDSQRIHRNILGGVCLVLSLAVIIVSLPPLESAESSLETYDGEHDEDGIVSDEDSAQDYRPSDNTVQMQWNSLPARVMRKCKSASAQRPLLVVSTMDGKISALDLSEGGQLQWSLDAGIGPLLSSSLSHVMEDETLWDLFKFIPDLDGNLFAWDGRNLDPAPFNTDSLLSSSFKLGDDVVMVGSKETRTYGINAHTGQLHYICSADGCQRYGDKPTEAEDVIILKFKQQTVRAVDVRSGMEKWNYSVGQHNINYVGGDVNVAADYEDDYDYNDELCLDNDEELIDTDRVPHFQVSLDANKFMAVSNSNPRKELWNHKFTTEIATAWTIVDGVVEHLDLLSVDINPSVSPDDRLVPYIGSRQPPFIAMYDNQLYIRPSAILQRQVQEVHMTTTSLPYIEDSSSNAVAYPRLNWRPYVSSALSRTPIIGPLQTEGENGDYRGEGARSPIWNQYPFDTGYIFHREKVCQVPLLPFVPSKRNDKVTDNESMLGEDEDVNILLGFSIWTWWREMVLSSVLLAVLWQLLFHNVLKKACEAVADEAEAEVVVAEEAGSFEGVQEIIIRESKEEFKSRYLSDFEHQECLGKGGFGIVFQAKNKVDESSYAIKRITLPRREEAREKVLREARALARLEHIGIVRYFQSWIEEPPPGWQEDKDKQLLGEGAYANSPLSSILSTATFNKDSELVRNKKQFLQQTSSDPTSSKKLTKFGGENGQNSSEQKSGIYDGSLTGSFDVDNEDTSGAFSVEFIVEGEFGSELLKNDGVRLEGFEPPFGKKIEETDSTSQGDMSIPFQRYRTDHSNSIDIVFEDSKNNDKTDTKTKSGHFKVDDISSESDMGDFHEEQKDNSDINLKIIHNLSRESAIDVKNGGDVVPKVYLYIQMQLCRKDTLKDWLIAHTDRDRNRVLHVFQEILGAVNYVHGCGMIHRDLKPSNIFFSMDGTVKVGDFGLVTAMDTDVDISVLQEEGAAGMQPHTTQVGTQLYMSPEQVKGHSYDHKVDIYSLGLIFFELLNSFSTQMERIMVMTKVKQQDFPWIFAQEFPTERNIIKWLLSFNPCERPTTDDLLESELFQELYKNFCPPVTRIRSRYSSSSLS